MTRNKVKLELIEDNSSRKATYKKRNKGLMKKANELTTLCGVEACAILYGPYDPQPEVWPNPRGVNHVLKRFKNFTKEEQGKNMFDQESYLKMRIAKTTQLLEKLRNHNKEMEINEVIFKCLSGEKCIEDLNLQETIDLCKVTHKTLLEIGDRIEFINKTTTNN
ncbi:unnamed protein product [Amaranthus hypochondriacus]